MFIRSTILATGIVLGLSSAAMAGNSGSIVQNGNGNTSGISQRGNLGNDGQIVQFGDRNRAEVAQRGQYNNAGIGQNGSLNSGSIFQSQFQFRRRY